jgi:hypothetical protein
VEGPATCPPWDKELVNELKELLEKARVDALAALAERREAGGFRAGYRQPSDAPPRTTRSAAKRRSERGEGGAPQHLSWVMHACRPSAPFPLEPVDARRTPSMHHVHSILVFLFRFEPPSPRPSPISP